MGRAWSEEPDGLSDGASWLLAVKPIGYRFVEQPMEILRPARPGLDIPDVFERLQWKVSSGASNQRHLPRRAAVDLHLRHAQRADLDPGQLWQNDIIHVGDA